MAKKKNIEIQKVVEYNEKITNLPENIPQEGVEEITIAKKLLSLYNLQQICSQIDKIRVVRGELPNEVRDLEDALEGMQTRIIKHKEELDELKHRIVAQDMKIKESNALIKRYEEQQNNVRNNREYESLTKEIEYEKLEIQVAEKHKGKFSADIVTKTENIAECEEKLKELVEIRNQKKNELADIIADTEKEELELIEKAEQLKKNVDNRLLNAFERIRNNARNGLAIVLIERDACGGCFSTIPPQRQLDIRLHKKIIVCEACGRIFIDKQLVESANPVKA
jgi:predicted  nucleic acid-binding Zn-ribbon protein